MEEIGFFKKENVGDVSYVLKRKSCDALAWVYIINCIIFIFSGYIRKASTIPSITKHIPCATNRIQFIKVVYYS
jgi:hypothetical protein